MSDNDKYDKKKKTKSSSKEEEEPSSSSSSSSDDDDDLSPQNRAIASLNRAVRQLRRGDARGGLSMAMADTPLSVLEEGGMKIDPMWKIPIWKGVELADKEALCEGMVPCPESEPGPSSSSRKKKATRTRRASHASRRFSRTMRHLRFEPRRPFVSSAAPKQQQRDDEDKKEEGGEEELLTQGNDDPDLEQYICDEDDIVMRGVFLRERGGVVNVFAPGPYVPETDHDEDT